MTAYGDRVIRATRQVLLEVFQLLEKFNEQNYIPKNEFLDITGISAIAEPGCELGFDVNKKVKVDGVLPNGKLYSTEIKSAGIMPLIVMKAHAMSIRNKTKDAYDIWFCLANHPDGVDVVAQEFLPHLKKASVKNALTLLFRHFGSINARGPTDVVSEEGTTDPEYRAFLRQDAFQRIQALLKSLSKTL
jgi:hypothetical protein